MFAFVSSWSNAGTGNITDKPDPFQIPVKGNELNLIMDVWKW